MLLATDLGEAWLPVDAAHAGRVVGRRDLYLPAGRPDGTGPPTAEVVSGIVLYALGGFLLALILLQVRGLAQVRPADHRRIGR
jgi:tetrahydromethanopterin S-methyltransferase subunit D